MFELGLMALFRTASQGALSGWEVCGIGSVDTLSNWRLDLGAGVGLELLPRRSQGDYGDLLRGFDVGLALMYTPHPSLVPLEMASAGMLVVSNSFENKTAESLQAISENLITAEPTVAGVSATLLKAMGDVGDYERRVRGASVRWPTRWEDSFTDDVIEKIASFLDAS